MGMTMSEKILARESGRTEAKAGEIVTARISAAMIQDALGPIVYRQFRELGVPVWDRNRVFPVVDHNCLPGIPENAKTTDETVKFAEDYQLPYLYNMQGVSHQIMVENGKIRPGQIAVGTDSHTVTYGALGAFSTGIGSTEMCAVLATGELWFKIPETIRILASGKFSKYVMSKDLMLKILSLLGTNGAIYKTLEFCGETIEKMSMASRLTLCNMAVEAGAKNGIIKPDEKTVQYMEGIGVSGEDYGWIFSDEDAVYDRELSLDVSDLAPQVAAPSSPANGVDVTELEGIRLDQVIIGACTNGRTEDIAVAAGIIRGHKLPHGFKCYIVPASNRVYTEASRAGYLADLSEAGCIIVNPGCGGCGIQMPMTEGQKCLGTHNRNFRGRMGSPESLVYLASPATAAASALRGQIADPRSIG